MTAADHDQVGWGVVVPVKRLAVAKSRLGVLGDAARRALALAFAEDVVRAALACPAVHRVLVVTDDEAAARTLRALGADVAPDPPGAGLNQALGHGARLLAADAGVAALSADLPALRPADLDAALSATTGRAVVADAAGTGTTLLAAVRGVALRPAFGERSLAAHLRSGALPLSAAPGLRCDVDTPEDLRAALALGVGLSTAAVMGAPAGCSPPQGTMLP